MQECLIREQKQVTKKIPPSKASFKKERRQGKEGLLGAPREERKRILFERQKEHSGERKARK